MLHQVIQNLFDLITGLIDQFELLLNGPMFLHGQCGFVHWAVMVAVPPIVTTLKASVDPHLYRFAGLEKDVVLRSAPGDDNGSTASSCVALAFGELSVSFIGFANDFLSLLSCQAFLRFELEPEKFAVLFVRIHRSHLLSGTRGSKAQEG